MSSEREQLKAKIGRVVHGNFHSVHGWDTPLVGKLLAIFDEFSADQLQTAKAEAQTVNRFEVINHLSDGSGREVVVWKGEPFTVENSLQDGGRTLKIFLRDVRQLTTPKEEKETE